MLDIRVRAGKEIVEEMPFARTNRRRSQG
jgi:hypothetical protein